MALTPFNVDIPYQEYVHDIIVWRPPQHIVDVMGLFGVVVLIYIAAWLLNRPRVVKMGDDAMVRQFRDARVKFVVGELITEGVEEAVFKDRLTRAESIDIYNKIGHAFGIVDLLPKRMLKKRLSRGETEHLKEQIRERLAAQTVQNVVPLKKQLVSKLKR